MVPRERQRTYRGALLTLMAVSLLKPGLSLRVTAGGSNGGGRPLALYEAPRSPKKQQMQSFILTSRPFIAREEENSNSDEYFMGSKKPVWDDLDHLYVLDCEGGKRCSHVVDVDYSGQDEEEQDRNNGYFGQQQDYLSNEIKEKFYFGKESVEEEDENNRWGNGEDSRYFYQRTSTTTPATSTTERTTTTSAPAVTTTPRRRRTTRWPEYQIEDERSSWWQAKRKPSIDNWRNKFITAERNRRTTYRPTTRMTTAAAASSQLRPAAASPTDRWEGSYYQGSSSRLPTLSSQIYSNSIDRYDSDVTSTTATYFDRPSTVRPGPAGADRRNSYDPFAYHASMRKSKMRKGFRGKGEYAARRSQSRISVAVPEYREQQPDYYFPEHWRINYNSRMAPSNHIDAAPPATPAPASGHYYYYKEGPGFSDEPWRVQTSSYNDRYGWQQQPRPNRRRHTEVPVWTSIDLEKPKWPTEN